MHIKPTAETPALVNYRAARPDGLAPVSWRVECYLVAGRRSVIALRNGASMFELVDRAEGDIDMWGRFCEALSECSPMAPEMGDAVRRRRLADKMIAVYSA